MHGTGEKGLGDVQEACGLSRGTQFMPQPVPTNLWSHSGVTLLTVTAHMVLPASGHQTALGMFDTIINTDVVPVPICSTSLTSLGCCEDKYLKRLSQMGHQSNGDHKSTGCNSRR